MIPGKRYTSIHSTLCSPTLTEDDRQSSSRLPHNNSNSEMIIFFQGLLRYISMIFYRNRTKCKKWKKTLKNWCKYEDVRYSLKCLEMHSSENNFQTKNKVSNKLHKFFYLNRNGLTPDTCISIWFDYTGMIDVKFSLSNFFCDIILSITVVGLCAQYFTALVCLAMARNPKHSDMATF